MDGIDKLTHEVRGRPLLAWAIDAVAAVDEVERIVVVCAPERQAAVRDAAWLSPRVSAVVSGGSRRHESVAAGLAALDSLARPIDGAGDRVVLVHDGARPLASRELIGAVLEAAFRHGAAIPIVPVTDTLKQIDGSRVAATVDRTDLASAQTPQGVRHRLLRDAFMTFPPSGPETWTDEAALLEACNIPVHALPGEPTNFKVTVPADLDRLEAALGGGGATPPALRVGSGIDSHPFGPGAPLAIGGIEIAGAPRLHGHSDGDAALHAIADALLGAAGLGDLGRMFPADATTPEGVASHELVATVVSRVRDAGHRPVSIDVTIVAARPRLAARLDEMRDAIAAIVGLPSEAVNVKASSGNLDGPDGAGRSISAQAIATVERIS